MKLNTLIMIAPRILCGVLLSLAVFPVTASDRRFAFSYETTTMPKGGLEIEPWATWRHYADKDVFDFRYELEYGVTDRFQLGAYLSDWRYTDAESDADKAEWKTAGLEAIYSLSDPNKSWLGSALYGEVLVGPEKLALEGKLLLQRNIGPLVIAYNAVVEAEWEGENYDERVGVWENTLGVSYQFSPRFFLGVEALHEVEFDDWRDAGEHVAYVGPNLSFRSKSATITLAGLFQATNVDGEPDSQVRVIVGFDF